MTDNDPAFPNAHLAALLGIKIGDLKQAIGFSSKANAADLLQEVLNRSQSDAQLALAVQQKMDKPAGSQSQYIRGDGSLANFPAVPDAINIVAPQKSAVTLNSAFRVSTTRPAFVCIMGSHSALISGGVLLSVGYSATEGGTYEEIASTNLITLLTVLQTAKESLFALLPAGHYLKVTAVGGNPTVTKVVWTL